MSAIDPAGDTCRVGFLRTVEPFAKARPQWLVQLDSRLRQVRLEAEEMVFRAGAPAEALYLVRRGGAAVFTDTRGRSVRLIERAGPGHLLGLVDVLGGARYATSARALAPTTLLRLGRDDLLHLLERDASLGLRFTLAVVSRHARNAAAALELGHRKEVRIRVARRVDLIIGQRRHERATIENLSRGGICLGGVPSSCFPDTPTRYAAHLIEGEPVLTFRGRVAWRQADRTGLAFVDRAPGHDLLVQAALRQLLRVPANPDAGAALDPRDTWPALPRGPRIPGSA